MNTRNLPPLKEKINNELRTPVTPGTPGDNQGYSTTQGPVFFDQPIKTDQEAITVNADNPLVKFDIQRAALDQIKLYQTLKVDVNDPKTVKKVKDAKKVARDLRLKVQNREKKIDAGLVADRKSLKIEAGTIIREIKETENLLIVEIKKDTDHKAELAEAARLAEVARVDKLADNMRILGTHCESGLMNGLTADQIQEKLDVFNQTQIPKDIFQEKYQAACDLLTHATETATANLAARKIFEVEEIKRVAEMAALKKQQQINDQVAWFNANFGWNSSLETMEKSLELLETSTFEDHLEETVKQQKIQAQEIIVAARARKAEDDRIAQEKTDREWIAAWDKAHAMNEALSVAVEDLPEDIKEVVDSADEEIKDITKAEVVHTGVEDPTFNETTPQEIVNEKKTFNSVMDKGLKTYAKATQETAKPTMSFHEKTISILENKKQALIDIRKNAKVGELTLTLSNGQASSVIMTDLDGMTNTLADIEKYLESKIQALKK